MEIAEKINKLASSWEEFKQKNSIEEFQSRMEKIETYINRPSCENKENNEYKANFVNYLRKGILSSDMQYMGNIRTGLPVRTEISDKIIYALTQQSIMRKLCDVEVIASDNITYVYDKSDFTAEWTSDDSNEYTHDVKDFRLISITSHKLHVQPKTTSEFLEDANIDVEKWLIERLAIAFSRKENSAFFNVNQEPNRPYGILSYAENKNRDRKIQIIRSKTEKTIDIEDIINLYYALPVEYAANGAFLMHRSTAQHIRKLKYTRTDQFIWETNFSKRTPNTLLGAPVYECNDIPEMNNGTYAVIFADFKRAYKIIDRKDINILRDPYSSKPYISFYASKRVGADLIDEHAVRILTTSKS